MGAYATDLLGVADKLPKSPKDEAPQEATDPPPAGKTSAMNKARASWAKGEK